MTAPRPLCAWCGLPLGRRAPPGMSASTEASWTLRGLGVPTVGWHMSAPDDGPTCFQQDPLAKRKHPLADNAREREELCRAIDARGPGRLVYAGRRTRRGPSGS